MPTPWSRSTSPSDCSSRSARVTVIRLTPNWATSSASDGISAPGYLDVDFTTMTPTHYLLQVAPLWEAQYSIQACTPSAQEARLLEVGPHEPCLVVVRRTMSRGVPITIARLVHPGSRHQIDGHFKP